MAVNFSDVTIKVTPEILNSKAQEVTAAITQMERLFDAVQNTVERTRYYWKGEAGDLHRKLFMEEKDDIMAILERLKEHPADLQKIARTYTVAEDNLTEAAGYMSSNLID